MVREGDARNQRPVKNVGQNSRRSLFIFFSTANSPHASRGSWAPVYKGTRVLEMMASAEKEKGRSAVYRGEEIYAYNAIYSSVSVCRSTHPPLQLSIEKNLSPLFPCFSKTESFLLSSFLSLSLLFLIYLRYTSREFHHPDPEIHLEILPKSPNRED